MAKTKILVIDDSALMRQVLGEVLAQDPSLEVVGTAPDPVTAWERVQKLQPDVLTLDVEMPRMDGLKFLELLMKARPTPVVMISSLTEKGAATTLRALELGAVDFVTKPRIDVRSGTVELGEEILRKVRAAAVSRVRFRAAPPPVVANAPRDKAPVSDALIQGTHKVIAVGASTGGTEALREFLVALPASAPGVVIVQHMPEKFTRSFAERLDAQCQIRVKEAVHGDRILPGHALLAPGGHHMQVARSGASYTVQVGQGAPVNHHRPSVDVLFQSCARCLGGNAVGVIMTGMGDDGARGLKQMRDAGAQTAAQDEATCVVFGMPREAIAVGAACEVLPLGKLAAFALRHAAPR